MDAVANAMQNPVARNSIAILNSAGAVITEMKAGERWRNYQVKAIGEILIDAKPPSKEAQVVSGTFQILLVDASGKEMLMRNTSGPAGRRYMVIGGILSFAPDEIFPLMSATNTAKFTD